jgi:metal-dependent HD superfamily phosphatase/phosphodiesterase
MLNVPVRENKKLEAVVARINGHVTLNTYWYCSNINSIDRLGINDHGPVHIRIVANLALKILRMLMEAGVQPSVEKHHKLTKDDAEVIVVLGRACTISGISCIVPITSRSRWRWRPICCPTF